MPRKNTQTVVAKPELTYEIEGAPLRLFVIRDGDAFMVPPDRSGWTLKLQHAGAYPEGAARDLVGRFGGEMVPLTEAARDFAVGATPAVLQAIAALGAR